MKLKSKIILIKNTHIVMEPLLIAYWSLSIVFWDGAVDKTIALIESMAIGW